MERKDDNNKFESSEKSRLRNANPERRLAAENALFYDFTMPSSLFLKDGLKTNSNNASYFLNPAAWLTYLHSQNNSSIGRITRISPVIVDNNVHEFELTGIAAIILNLDQYDTTLSPPDVSIAVERENALGVFTWSLEETLKGESNKIKGIYFPNVYGRNLTQRGSTFTASTDDDTIYLSPKSELKTNGDATSIRFDCSGYTGQLFIIPLNNAFTAFLDAFELEDSDKAVNLFLESIYSTYMN